MATATLHGTAELFASEITADHLITRVLVGSDAGLEFPVEYIVEDVITAGLGQVALSVRAGGREYTDPFVIVLPLNAKVTVTL